MKELKLHSIHAKLGAKFIEIEGYQVPMQYSSSIKEHNNVRENVGICDLSYRSRFEIEGDRKYKLIDRLVTKDIIGLDICSGEYALFLDQEGRIVTDVFIHKLKDIVLLDLNKKGRKNVRKLLGEAAKMHECEIVDVSRKYCLYTLQGPSSYNLISELTGKKSENLGDLDILVYKEGRIELFIVYKSWTGEEGYDIYVRRVHAEKVWKDLITRGKKYKITPFGCNAFESLRIEAGIMKFDYDFDEKNQVNEFANMGELVDLEKKDFVGKKIVDDHDYIEDTYMKFVGVETFKKLPKYMDDIEIDGLKIGKIKSSVKSPTLRRNISIASIAIDHSTIGTEVNVKIGNKLYGAQVVSLPFYIRA